MPPRLRHNLVANVVGRFFSVALAVLFTPVYLSILGIEAYGLIVFYITLQASSGILEMGLGRTCNRELAYHSLRGDAGHQAMRDTLRSLEGVYWLIAVLLAIALAAAAPWIANFWLSTSAFSPTYLSEVLVLAGCSIALRWPVGIYTGAMLGLQRHVPQNAVQMFMATLSWAGGAAVLWLYGPDVRAFFIWQMLASLCGVLAFRYLAWRLMPGPGLPGRFSVATLRGLAPFAVGVGGNAILGTILNQADKLILSAVLPLNQFGYYALAAMIANAVLALAEPVSNAIFPRFSQILGSGRDVSNIYHLATQAVSVLVIPLALVIAFFSHEVLHAYTGAVDVADRAAMALTVLVLAKMLQASMLIPYTVQMAYGSVRQTVYMNIASTIWLIPAVYLLGSVYGTVGAAAAWLAVGMAYVLVGIPLLHRVLLAGEGKQWALQAMAAPLVSVCVFLLMVSRLADKLPSGRLEQAVFLILVSGAGVGIAVLATPQVRGLVGQFFNRWKNT